MQDVGVHAELDAQRQAVTRAEGCKHRRQLLERGALRKIELDLVVGVCRSNSALSVLECGHRGDPLRLQSGVACLVMRQRAGVEEQSATIRQIG